MWSAHGPPERPWRMEPAEQVTKQTWHKYVQLRRRLLSLGRRPSTAAVVIYYLMVDSRSRFKLLFQQLEDDVWLC